MKTNRNIFRHIIKATGYLLLFLVVVVLSVYVIAWKSPPYYKAVRIFGRGDTILPFRQYSGDHPRPYIVRQKNMVVFGASHTRNPEDPEIALIQSSFKKAAPTIALVEGRLGFLLPGIMDPVKELGEGGLVKKLAGKAGIPVYNWDLSKNELAKQLLNRFEPGQIALAQILNPYFSQLRFGKPASPEAYIGEYFDRASYVGMGDRIKSVEDIDRLWKKYFPGEKDWRDTSDETTLPGYLGEMMIFTNDLRNQQLVNVIKELLSKGEKPFVICGSSHAYCIAPAFGNNFP